MILIGKFRAVIIYIGSEACLCIFLDVVCVVSYLILFILDGCKLELTGLGICGSYGRNSIYSHIFAVLHLIQTKGEA